MKHYFQVLLICLLGLVLFSCNPGTAPIAWLKKDGGRGFPESRGMAADGEGNIYITGNFIDTVTFDNRHLVTRGENDVFIAKYNPAGQLLWAQSAGGLNRDFGQAIATDAAGNCYLSGDFDGTVYFGRDSLVSSGGTDIFLAKYSSGGKFRWVKKMGGLSTDIAHGLTADAAGNTFITGHVVGPETTIGTFNIVGGRYGCVFLAKYNPKGQLQWVKNSVGSGTCKNVALDHAGNILMFGVLDDTLSFGNVTLTSSAPGDLFLAKFNPAGRLQWARKAGGSDYEFAEGLAVDSDGNAIITGSFYGKALFGSTWLTSRGEDDIFVAKYTAAGQPAWAIQAGGTDHDLGEAISADSKGNAYVAGYGTMGATSENEQDPVDGVFIGKINPAGKLVWQVKSRGLATAYGVAVGPNGQAYITGDFEDSCTIGNNTLRGKGYGRESFILKIKAAGDWF